MSAFIVASRRTAVMPRGGAFAGLALHELAAPVLRACLVDAGIEAAEVDEVIAANALGAGGNPARLCALAAGMPESVAGLTIDRQCAGGLDAIRLAAAMVCAGQADIVVAGGVESYSHRPLRFMTTATGPQPYDQPPFSPWPERDPEMAAAAAALADQLGISRAAQDEWAVTSHRKAQGADLPELVELSQGSLDGFTRRLTPAIAARAKPIVGSITAANAAVAADAAAFAVVVSERLAGRFSRAMRIAGAATLGAAPEQPGLSPLPAIRAALAQAGVRANDLTQSEIMEAYAVQAMACVQGAGLDVQRCNLKGGALARGHPIGASGAILVARLYHDLQSGQGLAAIAAAGGVGAALVLDAR